MKQHWEKLLLRLDALNLRERVLVFSSVTLVVVFLLNVVLIDPAYRKQKMLSDQMKRDQAEIAKIQTEIQGKVRAHGEHPDKVNQEKLKKLQQEMEALRADLSSMQKNLVPPQKMTAMLEDILKRNGRLRLVSLKNLPQVNLNKLDPAKSDGSMDKSTSKTAARVAESGAIYQHAVEIVVYGNYLDVMNYLTALESMRWQLYWSKANFQIDSYPNGSLTLTVYTLSLDKTWLNL
ncbi:MAG: MSHA biogenesis protein MshJ [Oxalobacter sp.]|nr:MAG: MSHA biogenesis protein MshJ [Oxalobacter sp.]